MSSQEEFQYHRAVVDLLEKIERHLAPAPEKAAKVSAFPVGNCVVCGELVAPYNKHAKYEGGYTCQRPQPAPPEPAAPVEMPDEVDRACDLLEWSGNVNAAAALRDAWRNLAQPVAVGMTEELKAVLDFAADTCGMAPEEVWRESKLKEIRPLISVVRQQAAQGRKVELGKVREFFDHCSWFARDAEIFRAALAELDAADGKGEGRG